MHICIDSMEKKRGQKAFNKYSQLGFDVSIKRLDYGDYLFYEDNPSNGVIFEYKTLSDFMTSITDDSVFQQTYNQSLHFPYHYLIIESDDISDYCMDLYRLGLAPNRFELNNRFKGAIRRIRCYSNVIIAKNQDEALYEIYHQAEKCLDNTSIYYSNIVRNQKNKSQDVVDFIINRTSGIGGRRTKLIRDTLDIKTLDELLNCSVEDFQTVKGIGVKTAQNLYDFIHSAD